MCIYFQVIEDTKKKEDTDEVVGAGDLLATLDVSDSPPSTVETVESDQPATVF